MPGQRTPTKRRRLMRRRAANNKIDNILAPPPSLVEYSGPITTVAHDDTTVTLFDSFDVTSSAGGVVSLRFDNNPSSARNWTEYSTSWNTYRVLGIRYSYFPVNVVNTTTTPGIFGYNSIVHGAVAAPASLSQAASTGISRPWIAFRRFMREWRMQETNEAVFQLTSAPASNSNTLVLYGNTGGAAVDYGTVMIEYLVQFKTHIL